MNPPTIGHARVFETMAGVGGDYKIFVSQTQDKKENPLDYKTKIKFIKSIHPEHADSVVEDASLNTILKVAVSLYNHGYTSASVVAGSDRLETFKKLLNDYNGVEGKAHGYYNFEPLEFVSSGARDPDSPGVEGASASKARDLAKEGDLEGFTAATGAGNLSEELYHAVRAGLGIKEAVDEHIVKVKGGYELKSKHGNKNLGKYPTRAGAEKRERQVQYFKHKG